MIDASLIPVIVGIGEYIDRPKDPRDALEPLSLWQQALHEANRDSGTNLLYKLDSIALVGSVTWRYHDPITLLCKSLQITPLQQHNASMGGETPVRLVHEAARAISRGEITTAAVVGGEAMNAVNKARKNKIRLNWTPPADKNHTVKLEGSRITTTKLSRTLGISSPTQMYPLYETAHGAHRGLSPAQASQESSRLWQQYSEVASDNQYAWLKEPKSTAQIETVTPDNRMICWPYRKLMVANPSVNQAAAIIVTSLENAQNSGVDDDKIIHIWGGGAAAEPDDFLERDNFHSSSAQAACLDKAVELIGGDGATFNHLELYSCFPIVPKMALQHLGLHAQSVCPTVTGGLTFFGGPLNNYMTHAVCAMVRQLRGKPDDKGLLYGQGGFVSKHHSLVLSHQPPTTPLEDDFSVQTQADSLRGPIPDYLDDYQGLATIETYTVLYSRDGGAYQGVVVLMTPAGERTLARVRPTDTESLALLTDDEHSAVGCEGYVTIDPFGKPAWSLHAPHSRPTSYQFISVEIVGHLTTVTINRPGALNCLHPDANAELATAFNRFEQDPEQWVAILTGAGERAFCTGNDLKAFSKAMSNRQPVEVPSTGYAGLTSRFNSTKPVIAAVNGAAMGGGFEIALACDLIIAADSAVFALPEPKVGLAALAGGLLRLPRQIGLKHAMGMILTGRHVNAYEGFDLGFVNQVTSASDLLSTAQAWAENIISCSPMAIKASKAIVQQGLEELSVEAAITAQMTYPETKALLRSSDIREGPMAFAQKRAPRWKNEV